MLNEMGTSNFDMDDISSEEENELSSYFDDDDSSSSSKDLDDDNTSDDTSDNNSNSRFNDDSNDDSDDDDDFPEDDDDDLDDYESDEEDEEDEEDDEDDNGDDDSDDDSDSDNSSGMKVINGDDDDGIRSYALKVGGDLLKAKKQVPEVNVEDIREQQRKAYLESLKLDTSDFESELDSVSLPDKEVKINGKQVNLKKFEEDYPEMVGISKAIALSLAKKIVTPQVRNIKDQLAGERFMGVLSSYHPDARLIRDTDDFKEWREKASDEVQALLTSDDPFNVALGLDIFKEDRIKALAVEKSIDKSKKGKKSKSKSKSSSKKSKKSNINKSKMKRDVYKGNLKSKVSKKARRGGFDPFDTSDAALRDAWEDDDD